MKWIIFLAMLAGTLHAALIRDNVLEVVYDEKTNLIWQDNISVKTDRFIWEDAIDYCEALDFANSQEWRVPNINELFSIVHMEHAFPSINTDIFKNIVPRYYYWSSTTFAGNTNFVWNIYFGYGHESTCTRNHRYYVRCVRDKEPEAVLPLQPSELPFLYYYLLN
ncbi:MAG: DUF1566 domain-containing protein [Sulfurimonas sp.]|nr:MAG: DUF1566 domain-containing protein [Sulfurimonas sp.]